MTVDVLSLPASRRVPWVFIAANILGPSTLLGGARSPDEPPMAIEIHGSDAPA